MYFFITVTIFLVCAVVGVLNSCGLMWLNVELTEKVFTFVFTEWTEEENNKPEKRIMKKE